MTPKQTPDFFSIKLHSSDEPPKDNKQDKGEKQKLKLNCWLCEGEEKVFNCTKITSTPDEERLH